ncbi:MAG: hypothetical protein WD225_03865 [Ilumatobacteraceae bacterium]
MPPTTRPAARLVLGPALFLVVLVVGLQTVQAVDERPPEPGMTVAADTLAPIAGEPVRCERERPDTEPAQRLAETLPAGGRVTAAMVVACPQAFDGRRVAFAGELVGDLLRRDGGAWVQLNDDAYALDVGPLPAHDDLRGVNSGLQVWVPQEHLDGLTPGRPGRRGDVVEVQGVIRRADPDDAGGLTLRADRLQVVAETTEVHVPVDGVQVALAAGACALAAGLWLIRRRETR